MNTLADAPTVLTVEECAALLRISRGAAYQAARCGELPAVRVGRSLRIPRAALERLLGAESLPTNDSEAGVREVNTRRQPRTLDQKHNRSPQASRYGEAK